MKKEALYYNKLGDNKVKCVLCPQSCTISENNVGSCGVRKNESGRLYSLVYSKPCSINIDPVEKKPLYHFMPGKEILSVGTLGCNLHCQNCQNDDISQEYDVDAYSKTVSPKEIVGLAIKKGIPMIAYTYNEPTVFFEYMIDIAKLARKEGIRNVIVSNGFINKEPLEELSQYIDAANIDIKSFSNDFYKRVCYGKLEPVLESVKLLYKKGVWIELTNLVVPTLSDDLGDIEKMCRWIKENLSEDVPLHFSRFFPQYKLDDLPPTRIETLKKAQEIAKKYLNYVYVGNVSQESNTVCKKCNNLLIQREGYDVKLHDFVLGKCSCGARIPGVWND